MRGGGAASGKEGPLGYFDKMQYMHVLASILDGDRICMFGDARLGSREVGNSRFGGEAIADLSKVSLSRGQALGFGLSFERKGMASRRHCRLARHNKVSDWPGQKESAVKTKASRACMQCIGHDLRPGALELPVREVVGHQGGIDVEMFWGNTRDERH
ncbi:hypothetical protein BDZ91DRAFT_836479 [Kalaharituber pfeilii]|nr:hypothetical protein BDZ91DRAFT_836479 [Kalaharituber pfeilii]